MNKSTRNKLKSYKQKVLAEAEGISWYSNPKEHPLPTIPEDDALQWYVAEIARSAPEIMKEIEELVSFVETHRASYRSIEQ